MAANRKHAAAAIMPKLLLPLLLLCAAGGISGAQGARLLRGFSGSGDLRILAVGDSITEGAVPSRGFNHPYTLKLRELLQQKFPQANVVIDNTGVGGSGIFATGFNKPTTLIPVSQEAISSAQRVGRRYDFAIVMLGINDLMRMGRSADDIIGGLSTIYDMALDSGADVIAVPPFAAPGFVSSGDYKEGERKKLADKIRQAADAQNARRSSPKMTVLDLQAGPMNFYGMGDGERGQWLDDGLHFTQQGYDRLAQYLADAIY